MIDHLDHAITIALAALALVSYSGLFVLRVRHDDRGSRLLFLDFLLMVAAVEVLADVVDLQVVAVLCQGGLMLGGVALLATFREG